MSTLDILMNGWSEYCTYLNRCNMCQFLDEYKLLCIRDHKSCKKKQKHIILLTLGFTK